MRRCGQPAGRPTSILGVPRWNIVNYNSSTVKETQLFRHFRSLHSTSKSVISSRGYSTTIDQMPNLIHHHIMQVCCYTGALASHDWWGLECSSTKGCWRSQCSSTPRGYFGGSETVYAGNRIHKDSLPNDFWLEVFDGWCSFETSHWSPELSEGISRCYCGIPSVCQLRGSPSLTLNPQTWEGVSVHSVFCLSIELMVTLNRRNRHT